MTSKRFKAIIEKDLEAFWGLDDLFDEIGGTTGEFQKHAVELLLEDVCALLDNADIRVVEVTGYAEEEMGNEVSKVDT
ncbi:MAG: hypothetical protein KatS3mg109_0081 [Pirellulaceae bacterium]|nr:MAG: hypothetical protein KatS3mg109_0081 [Pirellulaceae bacterium]